MTHFHCRCHYLVSNSEIFRWEVVVFEVEGHHGGEDPHHSVITEGVDAQDVEVPQEAGRHSISATTRGTHSSDELQVNQADLGGIFQVIPARA